MTKQSPIDKTSQQERWPKRHKSKLLALGAVLLVLGLPLLSVDLFYKYRFNIAFNEVEAIRSRVIEPTGGVEWLGGTYSPHLKGNGISSLVCIDTSCPSVSRTWFVQVEPGKEPELAANIRQAVGFHEIRIGESEKGNLRMLITTQTIDPKIIKPPHEASEGKAWILVQTKVSYQ